MPAKRVCTTSGCPTLVDKAGRCPGCKARAEALRGSATQRGYNSAGHMRFRRVVLTRDPICVCPDTDHGHAGACLSQSLVADHYPLSRRELIDGGLNPNDPQHGRGLCMPCHNKATSDRQPGGWNQR